MQTEQSEYIEERLRRYRRICRELDCIKDLSGNWISWKRWFYCRVLPSTACKTRHLYRCKVVSVYWSTEMPTEVLDIPVNSVSVTPFNFKLNPKYFWTKKANDFLVSATTATQSETINLLPISFVIRGQFTTDEKPIPNQGKKSYLYLEVRYKVKLTRL